MTMTMMAIFHKKTLGVSQLIFHFWTHSAFWIKINRSGSFDAFVTQPSLKSLQPLLPVLTTVNKQHDSVDKSTKGDNSSSIDGLISKDEMIAYFLRANPLLQCRMGPGFIHNFQEMTYLKPTFCEHCAGF
ncbi:hypothetical protein AMECASPLE_028059, partial [Ameca splendens]